MGEAESTESYVKRYSLDRLLSPGLLAALNLRRYGKGEHIIRSGESVEELLFFVDGRAKVYNQMENGSALLVRFYRPFDILGDVELFSFERYILDVVALEDTVCLGLTANAIRRGAEDNAGLLMELCGRLGRKLADFNVSAAINLRYPVENRLASYLLAVSGAPDSGADVYGTDDIGELADMLGSSRRQLSRAIRDFRDRGILEEKRGQNTRRFPRKARAPRERSLYLTT